MRRETWDGNVLIEVETFDLTLKTYTLERMGVIVVVRPMTADELAMFAQRPLDPTGALATLLAVEQVVSVQDAANAVGLTPEDLILEAEAWAAAGN